MKDKCSKCKQLFSDEQLTKFGEEYYCPKCLEEETVVCRECKKRIKRIDNHGTDGYPLCSECRERDYYYCQDCGALIHRHVAKFINGEPYCTACYDDYYENTIHEYDYKPCPIFYGDDNRYFGVELEIDGTGESNENADTILNVGNEIREHIYAKHDGSLCDGFEIVSHPMTIDYHMNNMYWDKVLDKADKLGYSSHNTKTCGLHIHVSRKALGENYDQQDETIGRIVYFVEKHWDKLLKFSRRTQYQLERWAARYGHRAHPKEMLEHVKSGNWNRYTCVNLENHNTIEFRIFRGTLKLNTFIATLQMVNKICDVAVSLSDEELCELEWNDFVNKITEKELLTYLQERELAEVNKNV